MASANYFIFRPVAGSKTEERGRKAYTHICREILELCEIINDMGHYKAKYHDSDDEEEVELQTSNTDNTTIVTFGDLFQVQKVYFRV